jgi:hypothetical protein
MSFGTFEAARTFPQHVFADRSDTRHIRGTSSDLAFVLDEVDNNRILSITMEAGNVMLALPDRRTSIGVTIRGVVTASTSQGSLIFASASGDNTNILTSACFGKSGALKVFTRKGVAMTIPRIEAGSTFTIFCTGVHWVVSAVGLIGNPLPGQTNLPDTGLFFTPVTVTIFPTIINNINTLSNVLFGPQLPPVVLSSQPLFTLI